MRKWLKDLRDERSLTQEELSKMAGISRSHYTQIEAGNKTPSIKVAQDIAEVLNFKWTLFFEERCSLKEHMEVG